MWVVVGWEGTGTVQVADLVGHETGMSEQHRLGRLDKELNPHEALTLLNLSDGLNLPIIIPTLFGI